MLSIDDSIFESYHNAYCNKSGAILFLANNKNKTTNLDKPTGANSSAIIPNCDNHIHETRKEKNTHTHNKINKPFYGNVHVMFLYIYIEWMCMGVGAGASEREDGMCCNEPIKMQWWQHNSKACCAYKNWTVDTWWQAELSQQQQSTLLKII